MKKNLLTILFSFILLAGGHKGFAQVVVTSSDSLACGVTCTNLTASVVGYSSTSSGITADDAWSGVIPIGFTFSFYGTPHTQCLIGSNGVVGFDLAYVGGSNSFSITTTLINAAASGEPDMENLIAAPWCDLLLSAGGTIDYAVGGTAPYRKFIVNFCADHMYQCTAQYTTSQIILYETTNIVEVHIAHKTYCTAWNGGNAEVGVVNTGSTSATTAPGRDFPSLWNATDEAWRFTPTGGGTSYSVISIPFAPVPLILSSIYWYNATTGAYISTGPTINVCPTTTTTYAAGALGCADTSFGYYTVTPGGSLPPITGTTSLCAGGTTPLSDITPGGVWSSDNTIVATVSGTGVVYGVSSGTADISYTISGCSATATITVGALPAITGGNSMCGFSITPLSDATAGGVWSSDNTLVATISDSGIVYGASSGTTDISYTVGSCSTGEVFTVGGLYSITGDTSICLGGTTILSNATAGGTWYSANTAVATVDSTAGVVTGIDTGGALIFYSTGGCTTYKVVIVIPSPGAGTISAQTTICIGSTISLSDGVSGGVWSISNSDATLSGLTVTGVSPGTDTINYEVTSATCGTATVTAVITILANADAGTITGDSVVCAGDTLTLTESVSGGVWGSSNSTVATVAGGVVHAVAAGTVTIGYAVSACGTATTSKTVTVLAAPPAGIISGGTPVCTGATFTLSETVTGGTWSSRNTAVATISAAGSVWAAATGTSIISYTTGPNSGGCYGVATYTVTVSSTPDFTVSGDLSQITCNGADNGSIIVTITNGNSHLQYSWSDPPGTAGTLSISGLAPGQYTIHVSDSLTKCAAAPTFIITQPDSLVITATTKDDTCDAGRGIANATATGGTLPYTYTWSNSKTGSEITSLLSGTYSVTVTDSNGCTRSTTATVIEDSCNNIIVFNALTPNGDGINDTWIIKGLNLYPDNTVQVFDKWGDMVYEKTNYQNDWAGKGKKGDIPDGTYYYVLKLNTANLKGGQNVWTGYLLIKR